MRCALLVCVAACTTSPSSLKPSIGASERDARLYVTASFDGDPDVDVRVTFRGTTRTPARFPGGLHAASIDLDTPVASDEPLAVDVDGVAMTMTAPAAFDTLDVPLFVSRSQSATVTWSPASADSMAWYVYVSACATSPGAMIPANATSLTFTASDWTPPMPPITNAQPTCTTDVDMVRSRATPIDPAFAGGGMVFERDVDLLFASTP